MGSATMLKSLLVDCVVFLASATIHLRTGDAVSSQHDGRTNWSAALLYIGNADNATSLVHALFKDITSLATAYSPPPQIRLYS